VTVFDELIFDRSAADLSSNSSRAYHNVADLERINEACQQLSLIFNNKGIENTVITKQSWGVFDYTEENLSQILNNITVLRGLVDVPATTPAVPASLNRPTLEMANDLERILRDVYVASQGMA